MRHPAMYIVLFEVTVRVASVMHLHGQRQQFDMLRAGLYAMHVAYFALRLGSLVQYLASR